MLKGANAEANGELKVDVGGGRLGCSCGARREGEARECNDLSGRYTKGARGVEPTGAL